MKIKSAIYFLEMKKKPVLQIESSFGERLARLRKAKGLTQGELGKKVGVSQRMICYYERESDHIPAALLPRLAKALNTSIDELLGTKKLKDDFEPQNPRLWRRLRKIEELPSNDQKMIIKFLDALLMQKQNS